MTAAGGVIPSGAQNVILYCVCTIDNIAVGPTEWFFNGTKVTLTEDDGSGAPYFRDNVPSPLIIPSFVTGNDGTYRCVSGRTIIPTSDNMITLTLLGICCELRSYHMNKYNNFIFRIVRCTYVGV